MEKLHGKKKSPTHQREGRIWQGKRESLKNPDMHMPSGLEYIYKVEPATGREAWFLSPLMACRTPNAMIRPGISPTFCIPTESIAPAQTPALGRQYTNSTHRHM